MNSPPLLGKQKAPMKNTSLHQHYAFQINADNTRGNAKRKKTGQIVHYPPTLFMFNEVYPSS